MSQFIEMFERPEQCKSRLGDLVSIRTGKLDANAASENGLYPFFTCGTETLSIDTYAFDCEAVLLAGNGEFCVKYYNGRFNAYQRTYVIESKDKNVLSGPFLFAWLQQYAVKLKEIAIGGVIKYIKMGDLTEASIYIPSIEKQNQFVAIAQQADKSKFVGFKSQFIEMFGNPLSQEQKYPMRKLSECCIINPRRTSVCLKDSDYVSFVPMPSVSENGTLQDVMDEEYGKVKKGFTYFENNDVLFAKITPCMENGKGAIAHSLTNGIGMGSTEFHILRPIKGLSNPYWLLCLTRMPIFRKLAEKNMTGTGGQKRVGAAFLENFMIGLPPIEAQNTFEELYKQADKSKLVLLQIVKSLNYNIN